MVTEECRKMALELGRKRVSKLFLELGRKPAPELGGKVLVKI
jgi:hypothetical protein